MTREEAINKTEKIMSGRFGMIHKSEMYNLIHKIFDDHQNEMLEKSKKNQEKKGRNNASQERDM